MTSLPGNFTPTYDANGNVTNDSSHIYTWDADGNSVTLDSVGLTFDAFDRMVEQNRSGVYTQIVYAPTGEKLALMNGQTLQKAFVPLPGGGSAVYTSTGLSYYRHPDWLGSSRLASTPTRTVYSTTAYAPFGEPYAQSGTADLSFTGQNQDTAGGSYDFLAREYAIQGRWPSPDPMGGNIGNPQSLNRYAYVMNNPLALVDPLGLASCTRDDTCDDKYDRYHQFSDAVGTGNCLLNFMPAPCQVANYYLQTGLGYIDFGPDWKFKGNLAYGTNCYVGVIVDAAFCLGDYPTPNPGGQGSTLWLQTKVFFQAWGREMKKETFQPGGCAYLFGTTFVGGGEAAGPGPVDVGKAATDSMKIGYVAEKGLAVPMRSSIFRSITRLGEMFDGLAAADFFVTSVESTVTEIKAAVSGECK